MGIHVGMGVGGLNDYWEASEGKKALRCSAECRRYESARGRLSVKIKVQKVDRVERHVSVSHI